MGFHSNPFIVDSDGKFLFGRYHLPFMAANIADANVDDYPAWLRSPRKWNRWMRSMRLKEWHFLSLNHDDIFVAFAVAQLGYVSNLFLYCIDKNKQQVFELGERFSFGRNLNLGSSSIQGLTSWQGKNCQVEIKNDIRGWDIAIQSKTDDLDFKAKVFMERDEAMALVFPLGKNRGAYTHKEAGNRLEGEVSFNGQHYKFSPTNSFGASDWSRSFLNHVTQWYFSCIGGLSTEGRRIGLNLSRLIYDDPQGASHENALWIDGKTYELGEARFKLPAQTELDQKPWQIEVFQKDNLDGPAIIKLDFHPSGSRKEDVSAGILQSKFTQAFGYYTGTIQWEQSIHTIDKVFGVAEKHYSKW